MTPQACSECLHRGQFCETHRGELVGRSIIDLARGYHRCSIDVWHIPLAAVPLAFATDLISLYREMRQSLMNRSLITRPRSGPSGRFGMMNTYLSPPVHTPAEPEDPRIRRFNERLERHGIQHQVADRCDCPVCAGARDRLRVDGPMAESSAWERVAEQSNGDGHVASRTSIERRRENSLRTDEVLGNIDELLQEFQTGEDVDGV